MSSTTTDPGDESASEIEREVDQRREELSASVDALQDRFSVETIVDDVMRSLSKNGGEVSRNLGRTIRNNPVPVILTGVGLAWLMASSNQPPYRKMDPRYRDDGDDDTATHRSGEYSETAGASPYGMKREDRSGSSDEAIGRPPVATSAVGSNASASETSPSPASSSTMGDRAKDALGSVKDRAGDIGREAQDRMDRAGNSAGRVGSNVADRAETFIEDQPLIVAALGFAAGLGIGGLLPRTRTEDDLLGARSDELKASAQQMAGEQADKAKAVAGAVADEAMTIADEAADEVDKKTSGGGEMVEKAKSQATSVADRLKDAGETEAEKQDRNDGSA